MPYIDSTGHPMTKLYTLGDLVSAAIVVLPGKPAFTTPVLRNQLIMADDIHWGPKMDYIR